MKEKIYNINNISAESQTLIFNKEKIDEQTLIGELGIKN
jgi:hypothetical protein